MLLLPLFKRKKSKVAFVFQPKYCLNGKKPKYLAFLAQLKGTPLISTNVTKLNLLIISLFHLY